MEAARVERVVEESVKYVEREFLIVIDKRGLGRQEAMEDTEGNPNVQVIVQDVEKERMEKRVVAFEENKEVNGESPYQRVYLNQSRRFKKEDEYDD